MELAETENKVPYYRMDLLFTIVQRGQGNKVIDENIKDVVYYNIVCPGRGTATSGILDMIGLGATEKDVVISFVRCDRTREVIGLITGSMNFSKPGTGICFSVPLQSIIGTRALRLISEGKPLKGDDQIG